MTTACPSAGHRRQPRDLFGARDGNAALEFALVAPVLLLLLFGILDFGQMMYGQVLLNGAVRQAARNATMENANTAAADTMVRKIIGAALPGVTFTSTRNSYVDFNDINRAEKFTDSNNNGTCNTGEPYTDDNGNGHWDADIGQSGNGSANDVVVYMVKAAYSPLFRIPTMPNQWVNITLSSTAVKKNQPFAAQTAYGAAAGTC